MTSSDAGYAGDVSAADAWEDLKASAAAVLIDVRTEAEWVYVGLPTLDSLEKTPVLAEWHSFPPAGVTPDFPARLASELAGRGVSRDAPLYFICRSGARSRQAAIAMTDAGFTQCFNVADGFEGPLDHERHRGGLGGWKAAGLPWKQT